MSYTLEAFCEDCRNSVTAGEEGRVEIQANMEKLLSEEAFIAEHFGPGAEAKITPLYTDDESGFQVLTHVYSEGKESPPHDHGDTWAVYGQAVAHTDMTVWRRTDDGFDETRAEVEPEKTYRLDPAMAGKFEPGDIHSIKFPAGARFLRVTGADLNKVPPRRFDPKASTVVEGAGVSGVVR